MCVEDALGEPFGQGSARRRSPIPKLGWDVCQGRDVRVPLPHRGKLEKPSRDAPYVPVSV